MQQILQRHLPEHLLPALPFGALAVLYLLYRWIYDALAVDATEIRIPLALWRSASDPALAMDALAAKLVWGLTLLAFALAWLGTVAACVKVLLDGGGDPGERAPSEEARHRPSRARWVALGITSAACAWVIHWSLGHNPLTLPPFEGTLETSFERMGVARGRLLLHLPTGLALAVTLLLAIATAGLLTPLPEERLNARQLRRRSRQLRWLLYGGAAVLLAGAAQAGALHRLPVALIQSEPATALGDAAQSATVATGSLWSLFLLALYLPAALVLSRESRRLAEGTLPDASEPERRSWLSEHGLETSPFQQVAELAAVLAPFLGSLPLQGIFQLMAG